ncbi:MAG: hypothetical protein JJ966_05210 [Balneolaceae bacterium]|nr:hypothetical protein [Balneolaceae bacterium]
MLRFFRQLRKTLLENGNLRKYFWYALGEILLVMIGILLALQVNNWNEDRKKELFEIGMLQELVVASERDSALVTDFFNPRIEIKESAIDSFLIAINSEVNLNEARLAELYNSLNVEFLFRFNAGPYETIKSNGLDIISNEVLRASISGMYETTLPAFKGFITITYEELKPVIQDLEPEFLINRIEWHNGEWHNHRYSKDGRMLQNEAFIRVLGYQVDIARNYRDRISTIQGYTLELRNAIRAELAKRGS